MRIERVVDQWGVFDGNRLLVMRSTKKAANEERRRRERLSRVLPQRNPIAKEYTR